MFDLFSSFKSDVKAFIASAHERITALEAKMEALGSYVKNDVAKVETDVTAKAAEVKQDVTAPVEAAVAEVKADAQ